MIRWTHYTAPVSSRTEIEWGVYLSVVATKHTLAFKVFGRYMIVTWVWTR